ncbi:hypothetical protein [Methanobrevibacter millerae]|uniref:Uncharacterized protein n=1 Tax=Methanobrevibacter millerae TaxID=230361 RepID=A0A1G5VLV8_9EURY|nr:hypothetical protein [Methanobrevibacter millerae]SDA46849.1 hypothetical protein SAMN02910315_00739 [Methanobrevibacter millerae]
MLIRLIVEFLVCEIITEGMIAMTLIFKDDCKKEFLEEIRNAKKESESIFIKDEFNRIELEYLELINRFYELQIKNCKLKAQNSDSEK